LSAYLLVAIKRANGDISKMLARQHSDG
jgi:hypothetical protein